MQEGAFICNLVGHMRTKVSPTRSDIIIRALDSLSLPLLECACAGGGARWSHVRIRMWTYVHVYSSSMADSCVQLPRIKEVRAYVKEASDDQG